MRELLFTYQDQIVSYPTRGCNIFDIFFSNCPKDISKCDHPTDIKLVRFGTYKTKTRTQDLIPGLSDHGIIHVESLVFYPKLNTLNH